MLESCLGVLLKDGKAGGIVVVIAIAIAMVGSWRAGMTKDLWICSGFCRACISKLRSSCDFDQHSETNEEGCDTD
jgi:hypothetical protein